MIYPNNTDEEIVVKQTTNYVYYANIPNMNISLTGD